MFLKFWLLWAFLGLSIATAVFWWALSRGQFDDSRRAALLPLDDVEDDPAPFAAGPSRGSRWHFAVLMGVVAISVGLVAFTILLSLGT